MSEAHALPCMHCQLLPDGNATCKLKGMVSAWKLLIRSIPRTGLGFFYADSTAGCTTELVKELAAAVQKRRMVLEAWHTEDNANVELVPWRSEKVVTSLVERYRPPRCRKVQEKKRNSCESRYLAFGQGWLKGAQDWLKWWDKDGKFVRKDFRRWLAAEKGGRRLKMKSRRDIAAANKAGWAGLYCRCAENSECGCGACE